MLNDPNYNFVKQHYKTGKESDYIIMRSFMGLPGFYTSNNILNILEQIK